MKNSKFKNKLNLLLNLGVIQDSFKHLKSLKYLDLSSTDLFDLDGCIFIQLTSLRTLKIERVSINCSSCWLPIAKRKSIELFGQCFNNKNTQQLNSLTDEQLRDSCSKRSSVDCSSDYCDPGTFNSLYKSLQSSKSSDTNNSSNASKNLTLEIVLSIIFTIILLIVIIAVTTLIYRWRQNKTLICWKFMSPSTMNETTIRQHKKEVINKNPSIIESVVTHGANMNVTPYSNNNYEDVHEATLADKRKHYNPMFTDSPKSEIRCHQSFLVSNGDSFHSKQMYSENL